MSDHGRKSAQEPRRGRVNSPHPSRNKKKEAKRKQNNDQTQKENNEQKENKNPKKNKAKTNPKTNPQPLSNNHTAASSSSASLCEASSSSSSQAKQSPADEMKARNTWLRNIVQEGRSIDSQSLLDVSRAFMTKLRVKNESILTAIIQSLIPLDANLLFRKQQFSELCELFSGLIFFDPALQVQIGSIANGVLSKHGEDLVAVISKALQVPIIADTLFLLNQRLPLVLRVLVTLMERLPGVFGVKILQMQSSILRVLTACETIAKRPASSMPNFDQIHTLADRIKDLLEAFEQGELQNLRQQVHAVCDKEEQLAAEMQAAREVEEDAKYLAPQGEALTSYLKIEAIPTFTELRARKPPADLPAINITDRPYENSHHLLNTNVRLMKEDIVRSLREGTKLWREGKRREAEDSIHIYDRCTVMSIVCDKNNGLIYRIRFQAPRGKSFPWNRSNRLMYGSLVALTSDKFDSEPVWAEVSNRDDAFMLNRTFPSIEIRLLRGSQHQSLVELVGMEDYFSLVEASQSYFLPYKHVIEAMQQLGKSNGLPFTRYLVNRELNPFPPLYLRDANASDCSLFGQKFNIRDHHQWPKELSITVGMKLDEFQTAALRHLLTNELAVVVGPPGTGKTFVALKALEVLLQQGNRKSRQDEGPILIIALTNHALDQLLEGVHKFEQNIIRIGSRSESLLLQSKSLHEVRRKAKESRSLLKTQGLGRLFTERDEVMGTIIHNIVAMKNGLTLKVLEEQLESGDDLATEDQITCLRELYDDNTLQSEDEGETEERKEATDAAEQIKNTKKFNRKARKPARAVAASTSSSSVPAAENDSEQWEKAGAKRREKLVRRHDPVDFWLREGEISHAREVKRAKHEQKVKELAEAAAAKKTIPASQNQFAALDEEMRQLNITSSQLPPSSSTSPSTAAVSSSSAACSSQQFSSDRSSTTSAAVLPDDEEFINTENDGEEDEEDVKRELEERLLEDIPITRIITEAHDIKQAKCPKNYHEPSNPRVTNLGDLSMHERECLHWYWLRQYRQTILNELRPALEKFEGLNQEIKEHHRWSDVDLLRKARVVGMTTTGAAQFQNLIQLLNPKIVMMEEAAEVLESHVLACLAPSVQHLMLIGDDKQLQPTTSHYDLTRIYKLHISLFERLLIPIKNEKMSHEQLQTQRRMLPSIRELSSFHYQDNIKDGPNVRYNPLQGVAHNLYFLSHHHREGGDNAEHERKNEFEAEMLVKLGIYLIKSENISPTEIMLLTTYKGQKRLITSYVNKLIPNADDPLRKMLVQVVDKYQGCENTIILLSLVRSNGPQSTSSTRTTRNPLGYLNVDNRMCVALSRAKRAMFVIGNFDMLKNHNQSWRTICSRVEKENRLGTALPLYCPRHELRNSVSKPEDFKNVPLGGCLKPCSTKMPCGHECKKTCHGFDPKHEKTPCPEKCLRHYESCEHTCPDKCHGGAMFTSEEKQCKPCRTTVKKTVPACGHEQEMPCHLPPTEWQCMERVLVPLPCGHSIRASCHQKTDPFDCITLVDVTRDCGHREPNVQCAKKASVKDTECLQPCTQVLECGDNCPGKCGQCKKRKEHLSCQKKCTRELKCGHVCNTPHGCQESCPPCMEMCPYRCTHSKRCSHPCWAPCPPCKEKCAWRCAHYKCTRECGEPCDRPYCMEACNKKLLCGHSCIGVCGEPCLSVCRVCNPEVEVMDELFMTAPLGEVEGEAKFLQLECGHIFEVSSLDTHMSQDLKDKTTSTDSVEIRLPSCPTCKSKIRNSVRYGTIVNSAIDDIEEIKYMNNLKIEKELERLWIQCANMKEEEKKRWIEEQRKLLAIAEPRGAGHYFKCKNGHVYVIGDCGGAMERGVCPDCKEVIGGSSHSLAEGNRPAFNHGSTGSPWMPNLVALPSDFEAPAVIRQPAPRPPRERRLHFRFAVPSMGGTETSSSSSVPIQRSSAGSLATPATAITQNRAPTQNITPAYAFSASAIGSSSVGIHPPSASSIRALQDLEYEEALRLDKLNGLA